MQTFEPTNLKEQFGQLERLHDFTLIPIFDRVTDYFLSDLNHNPSKYDVSDGRGMEQPGEGLWRYVNSGYNLVVDGKIVSMTVRRTNIDVVDDDEYLWMVNRVEFDGNKEGTNKLCGHFKRFIGQQKLDELIKAATEELQKGKTYHLSQEMCGFYLNDTSCFF